MTPRPRGFTTLEALGALALTTVVLSALLLLVQPALDEVARVPESTSLHDRARAAESVVRHALEPAGSGADLLGRGPLTDAVPAVWPRRLGRWSADADGSAWGDRFSVVRVPWLAAQAPVSAPVSAGETLVELAPHAACGSHTSCGFSPGDHLGLVEERGAISFARVAGTMGLVLEHDLPGAPGVELPAFAAAIDMSVIYFDAGRRQLRRYDGLANDQPLIDDVVWMAVRYYGDPLPPRRPSAPGEQTCVVDAAGLPLLPLAGPVPAPLVELALPDLTDGPWCGRAPWRFDADLLRVRAVRVAIRLQAESPAVRGSGLDFQHPGTSHRAAQHVRDLAIDVFVTPRVLAAGG